MLPNRVGKRSSQAQKDLNLTSNDKIQHENTITPSEPRHLKALNQKLLDQGTMVASLIFLTNYIFEVWNFITHKFLCMHNILFPHVWFW
jgi:hypothetical protein